MLCCLLWKIIIITGYGHNGDVNKSYYYDSVIKKIVKPSNSTDGIMKKLLIKPNTIFKLFELLRKRVLDHVLLKECKPNWSIHDEGWGKCYKKAFVTICIAQFIHRVMAYIHSSPIWGTYGGFGGGSNFFDGLFWLICKCQQI